MKSIDDIQCAIEDDSKIDKLKLEFEILRTHELMSKYLKYHYDYKVGIARGETLLNECVVRLMRFYQGKGTSQDYRDKPFNDVVKNNNDLTRYIEADVDYTSIKENMEKLYSTRDMLYSMIDSLKYRNNSLASIIELRKFEAGV